MSDDGIRAAAPLGVRSPGSDVDGTGPYVVTTKRPTAFPGDRSSAPLILSRRAVATLEGSSAVDLSQPVVPCEYLGARVMAYALVLQAAQRSKSWLYEDFEPHFKAALALTESGGTVGPLPDGTVIEVERLSPLMLAARCAAPGSLVMSCVRTHDLQPLCDFFNARQPT